ncbi:MULTISPECIES: hypothetical protein [Halobacteriales]|uniref:hypothetical protein n=1 Tax=Halobacteriales TaxID=2235 RepID=UPI001CA3D2DC|nr:MULTISPECIES: hypothetical protein [Halobacteria]MDT3436573.1 hypothetical protein [Haloarcula sp. 1CSR25-25]QZY00520.1 hypothetical protein K6T25_05400 [Halobaculum rubrum]
MKIIGIDTKDNRLRIHIRAGSDDDDDLVAYGLPRHIDRLPADAEVRIRRVLSGHNIEQYPEGAYIGTFGSETLEDEEMRIIRDHREIVSDPYPSDIDLTEFPPEEGQLYKW